MAKRRPANTAFKQQRLSACQPILTPLPVILTFLGIGIVFIPLGAALLKASLDVQEVEFRYDDTCAANSTCNITFQITETMSAPVYVYYKLSNYYQNHRRYVKSRNDGQLKGDNITSTSQISSCSPLVSYNDTDDINLIYVPCGLIAASFFNDTYALTAPDNSTVSWTSDGIAWQSDLDKKFSGPPAGQQGIRLKHNNEVFNFTDPDFVVWMRVAGLPVFRKLTRIIKTDLQPGTYTVSIGNHYPVSDFSGQKSFILSTTTWIGGKNNFLGIAYLVTGGVCLILALAFFIKHLVHPRQLGDLSLIEWMDRPSPTATSSGL